MIQSLGFIALKENEHKEEKEKEKEKEKRKEIKERREYTVIICVPHNLSLSVFEAYGQ